MPPNAAAKKQGFPAVPDLKGLRARGGGIGYED